MNQWIVSYRNFDPTSARLRETLFTLANGYFATRGAHEDSISEIHYPGTYLAGGYNRASSIVGGQTLINEDLVNFPNWLPLTFRVEGEDWFSIENVRLLSYTEMLHLKRGLSKRIIKFEDMKGRIFVIHSLRFVSQNNPHLAGIRYSIISENWAGNITIRSSIKGDVINNGVPRYKELNNHHLDVIQKGAFDDEYLFLQAKTRESHIEVSEVIKTEIYRNKLKLRSVNEVIEEEKNIHQSFKVKLIPNEKITITKVLSIFSSKDHALCENLYDAKNLIKSIPSFNVLLSNHMLSWKHLWNKADIELDSPNNEQQLIRLHIFHSLQSLSKHSVNADYGIPARGLHGEAYRGHVFWDEIFILPFFFYNFPDIARALLMYRYKRLDGARKLAKENGYNGAMFPWQSASNGEEETQKFHLNPYSSKWGPDFSCRQRHINLAIVYNIWNYYQITHDIDFLSEYGAEVIFEIAKFISSMAKFNTTKNRYEIKGVMGPDEYHENYPNSAEPGLNNNTYTNIMGVWALERALELMHILSESSVKLLCESLDITAQEISKWKNITHTMFIPFHENVLSQFEGYEHLKEFDWNLYKEKYPKLERLDRVLKAENQDPNEFQIAKQADTLMLFYLLEEKEIKRILDQLGYVYDDEIRIQTIKYYLQRTSHGSTLSKITFASLLFNHEPERANELFQEALVSDLLDTQGGTTQEGIHLGVMVGTTTILMRDFAGLRVTEDLLTLDPVLPDWLQRLKFNVMFQHNIYEIEIFPEACYITLLEHYNSTTQIRIKNQIIELQVKNTSCIPLQKKSFINVPPFDQLTAQF